MIKLPEYSYFIPNKKGEWMFCAVHSGRLEGDGMSFRYSVQMLVERSKEIGLEAEYNWEIGTVTVGPFKKIFESNEKGLEKAQAWLCAEFKKAIPRFMETPHVMKLNDEFFDLMKNGKKKIEVRLNDKKRERLAVGDCIIFCRKSDLSDKLFTVVTDLERFEDFEELFSHYPIEMFGYEDKTVEEMVELTHTIYSSGQRKKYRTLAITVRPYIHLK